MSNIFQELCLNQSLSKAGLSAGASIGGDLLVHVFVLIIIGQTVHVLVPAEVQSAGPVYHQVGPVRTVPQAVVVIPELELAPVSHDQRLHVVPPEAGGDEGEDALVPGPQLQEGGAPGALLLVIQGGAQTVRYLTCQELEAQVREYF